jgi:hypothetical protein
MQDALANDAESGSQAPSIWRLWHFFQIPHRLECSRRLTAKNESPRCAQFVEAEINGQAIPEQRIWMLSG